MDEIHERFFTDRCQQWLCKATEIYEDIPLLKLLLNRTRCTKTSLQLEIEGAGGQLQETCSHALSQLHKAQQHISLCIVARCDRLAHCRSYLQKQNRVLDG